MFLVTGKENTTTPPPSFTCLYIDYFNVYLLHCEMLGVIVGSIDCMTNWDNEQNIKNKDFSLTK